MQPAGRMAESNIQQLYDVPCYQQMMQDEDLMWIRMVKAKT